MKRLPALPIVLASIALAIPGTAAAQTTAVPTNVQLTPGLEELVVTWDYTEDATCVLTSANTDGFEVVYRKDGQSWRGLHQVQRNRDDVPEGDSSPNNANNGGFEIFKTGDLSYPPKTVVIGARTHNAGSYKNDGVALTPGALYEVRVRAYSNVNDCGISGYSQVMSARLTDEVVLVTNIDETSVAAGLSPDGYDNAQAFLTGGNAFGYTLTGMNVEMSVGAGAQTASVSIHEISNGNPGAKLATLTAPDSFADGANAFTHPGLYLAPNTYYFAVIDHTAGSGVEIENTLSDADSGKAGWSVDNGRRWRTASQTAWTTNTSAWNISVVGIVRTTARPMATVSAGTSPVTEGTAADFTVTLSSAAPAGGLTVNLSVSEAAGSDYVAPGDEGDKTLEFAEGDTSKAYSVATASDFIDEPNGSVTVTLADGLGYTLGTMTSASVTVNDDDAPPHFTVSPTSLRVSENGGTATFTVGLSEDPAPPGTESDEASSYDVYISLESAALEGQSGTFKGLEAVKLDPDFGNGESLIFTAGPSGNWNTPQTVKVTGLPDTSVGDRVVTLRYTTDAFASLEVVEVTVTVTDDGGGDVRSVSLSASSNPVTEGQTVGVGVTLSRPAEAVVQIPLTLHPGTAEPGDHQQLSSVWVQAGDTIAFGNIGTARDDDTDDETFTVSLGSPLPTGITAGAPSSVEIVIRDVGPGGSGTGTGTDSDTSTGSGTDTNTDTETGSEDGDSALSSDAALSGLAGHTSTDGADFGGTLALVPDFSAETESYTADVPHSITHVTLTPTVSDPDAVVEVGLQGSALAEVTSGEPAPAIALATGENVIEVAVTAEDGSTTRTYTVTVTREETATVEAVITDDASAREHLFPLLADGDGFHSYLFLTNVSNPGNRCTLTLHGEGLDASRFTAHAALTGADIDLGDTGADVVLTTAGEGDLAVGYAKLACTHPAVARMLLVQESDDGVPTAMTNLERAQAINTFQFPVLPGLGRLGLVLANDNTLEAACAVEVETADGASVGGADLTVTTQSNVVRFLDELVPMGDDASDGTARVTCDRPVAALGVPLHGGDLAALGGVDLEAAGSTDSESRSHQILPLVQDGGGFQSNLVVTNLSEAANACTMNFEVPGVPAARFQSAAGVTWDGFHTAVLELAGSGSQISLSSLNRSTIVSFGYAALDCDAPADVRNLLTVRASDGETGIAAVAPVQSAREVRFPVLPRLGSLALMMSNATEANASCEATLAATGQDETIAAGSPVQVESESTAIRFLADLFELPDDFTGGTATLLCDQDIAAVSLPAADAAFTAMPPLLPGSDTAQAAAEEEAN